MGEDKRPPPPTSKYFNKEGFRAGFERMTHRIIARDIIHFATRAWMKQHTEYILFYHEKIKFSAQKSRKTRDFEKKSISEIWQK